MDRNDLHIGQRVWTTGTNKLGVKGVIDGIITEIGNDHVWLYIDWRSPQYHSRLINQIYLTEEIAEQDLAYLENYILYRLQSHGRKR